jgi:phosphatidylglycerol:prolipoprotein diacylglycerol transferase
MPTMSFLAITYPNIDPVAFSLGPVSVKWYGLAYMTGLLAGWLYIKRLLATPPLWRSDKPPFPPLVADDLLLWITIAVIVGGRLGQVLLYDPGYYAQHPMEIFEVWRGGMAFHGALVASAVAIVLFARWQKTNPLSIMDVCCAAVPFGIFLGRIANFINSEHWGRPSSVAWSMVFPNGGNYTRHPSQLYEAALEGLVLLVIMRLMTHRVLALKQPGLTAGVWLVWYAIARTISEFFREPESVHAFNLGPFTAGQLYSIPMLLAGAWLIWNARRKAEGERAAA